jgi:poly-beta-hydroxyalkanoate depolymerase
MAPVAPNLDDLIARARAHKMTPTERREQRVSMVMGLRGHTSTLTRDEVETLLDEFEGSAH